MENIQFTYPYWWLFIVALTSACLAYWYYVKNDDIRPLYVKYILITLRFLALFIIGLLLLKPIISRQRTVEVPQQTVILMDRSSSVGDIFDNESKQRLNKSLSTLSKSSDQTVLSFDNRLHALTDSMIWEGRATNISQAIEDVRRQFEPGSIGQLILLTDGIYNQGGNPIQMFDHSAIPVHCIGMGDTTQYADVSIRRVLHSDIGYVDDILVVEADVYAQHVPVLNKTVRLQLEDKDGWKTIDQTSISIGADELSTVSLELPISQEGTLRCRITIEKIPEEKNVFNNTKELFVEGLRSRQNIHIIARTPHPDVSAIRRSLEQYKNYNVRFNVINDPDIKYLGNTDLFILFDLPYPNLNIPILDRIRNGGKSLLFCTSPKTDWEGFKKWQDLIDVRPKTRDANTVSLVLSPNFSSFTLSEMSQKRISSFPPLKAPFADVSTTGQVKIFAYQQVGQIDTQNPLIAVGKSMGRRIGVFLASEIFRWPIYEYARHENTAAYDELVNQLVQYLTLREDKRRLRAKMNTSIFSENESIQILAELFNESYENIISENLSVTVFDSAGNQYPHALSVVGDHYETSFGPLRAGSYSYTIESPFDDVKDFNGSFRVRTSELEAAQTVADHSMLHLLAQRSGGTFTQWPVDLNEYVDVLKKNAAVKPKLIQEKMVERWIDNFWLLLFILLLLSAEWILRRLYSRY